MTDIHKLLQQMEQQESQLRSQQFLAPCVRGGKVRARVAGMIYTFSLASSFLNEFEGWGIFQPLDAQTVQLVEEADLATVDAYLQQLPAFRLRLVRSLRGQTWLAYPVNEGDARQRLGFLKPVALHLVTEGVPFEQVCARWDGSTFWFEVGDRRADFAIADALQAALKKEILPESLTFTGLTPEARTTYDLVTQAIEGFCPQQRDAKQLRQALKTGGGELQQFQDRGDYWTVTWQTSDGTIHTSAIAKADLTVISSGICLSGRDRDFDLQSLVGVIENRSA